MSNDICDEQSASTVEACASIKCHRQPLRRMRLRYCQGCATTSTTSTSEENPTAMAKLTTIMSTTSIRFHSSNMRYHTPLLSKQIVHRRCHYSFTWLLPSEYLQRCIGGSSRISLAIPLEVSCFGLWLVIAHVGLWKRMLVVDIIVVYLAIAVRFSSDVLLVEVVVHP